MLGSLICCSRLPKQAQFQRWVVVFKVLKCSSAAQDWQTSLVPLGFGFRIHGCSPVVFDVSVLETEDQVQAARDQQCEHREQQKAKPSRHPQQRMRCTDIHR